MKALATIVAVVGVVALALGIFALGAWIFELLWNWVIVGAFHGPRLSFWYSAGLLLLISIVGRSFRTTVSKKD